MYKVYKVPFECILNLNTSSPALQYLPLKGEGKTSPKPFFEIVFHFVQISIWLNLVCENVRNVTLPLEGNFASLCRVFFENIEGDEVLYTKN